MSSFEKAYSIAMMELGEQEIKGEAHNPRILEYQATTKLAATTDESPWCAAFVCWCLEKAGIGSTKASNAQSYLKWGQEVTAPYEGCIVVLRRGKLPWQGHVGFLVKITDKAVFVLGGNQKDMVCVQEFPIYRVMDFREPRLP